MTHWSNIVLLSILSSLLLLLIWDLCQKNNSILRSYPLIGYIRYIAEWLGVYFRPFFFTRDRRPVGTIYFVDAPFPILGSDEVHTLPVTIGQQCREPYTTSSLINISAMSYGSISKNAILALSQGAKMAGCWLNTGEGGVSSYHLEGGSDLIAQIGTAKFGFRDEKGNLCDIRLKEIAAKPQVKMFEIKLSQGAKPGKGGLLPGVKVTREIAKIRDIPVHEDAISPNRFPEISNSKELLDFISHIREVTGKPTGFKVVLGDYSWLSELCEEIVTRGLEHAPDFITLDGAEGGTGAAPMSLIDYMGLPIAESLPVLVDTLVKYGLRDRIKIIASGKLSTPWMVVWALCVGADFVNSSRGFMFAMGCIQALKCNKNTCPTGITTHNPSFIGTAIECYNFILYAPVIDMDINEQQQ